MKNKAYLSKQSVKRRHPKEHSTFSNLIGAVRKVTFFSLKICCLLMLVVSISFLFLYLYQHLISSPYVMLEEVNITGVDEKIKRELIEIAELDSELSLLTINLKGIKQMMESHPWVRSVEMEKNFPHALRIHAEREVAYAIVVLDRLYYMNRYGEPFKELEYSDNKDFPVITGVSPHEADQRHYMKLAAKILSVFESEEGDWSIDNLSELHFEDSEKVSLYSTSLPVVLKGGCDELVEKKKELKKLMDHLKKTGRIHMVKAIDLNYSDGAVVSVRDSG